MKKTFTLVFLLVCLASNAQTPWPSVSWNAADNLTPIMDIDGIAELSGLHWNPVTNRLYCVQNDGRLRVLQMDNSAMGFTQIANKALSGGPEGITQANFSANEFYVIDENSYEIQKYTHTANFSSLTLSRHWDLLSAPSPMEDTENTGPEGIVFVPDSALSSAGFISQQTGNLYTSVKGMGGLMFIAHQDEGYVWVFDVNPNVNDDFAYVGKYETNRAESCDLAFDRSANVLYILHNLDDNYLETTNLSSVATSGNARKFATANEYFIANPEANANIEGFALMPKCPEANVQGAFLCRDVSGSSEEALDALRWFSPFVADGLCTPPLGVDNPDAIDFAIFPNPGNELITVVLTDVVDIEVTFTNTLGQIVLSRSITGETSLDVSMLSSGLYFVTAKLQENTETVKWIKE